MLARFTATHNQTHTVYLILFYTLCFTEYLLELQG